MTRSVRFLPVARLEMIEAFDWYEGRRPGLGVEFTAEADRQILRIAENPLHFSPVLADIRRARLKRFPYGLFFRPVDEGIFVIACFHANRDPKVWRERV